MTETASTGRDLAPVPGPLVLLTRHGRTPFIAGRSHEDVVRRFGSLDAADGVESAAAVTSSARAVLDSLRSLAPEEAVVLVAHDAVNRMLLAALDPGLGPVEAIGQRTACWNLLTLHRGVWQVLSVDQRPQA